MRQPVYSFVVQLGSTYLSGISARLCHGSFDDPGPADYALRGHQVQVARVASISAGPRGSLEAVDNMLDESGFVNAVGGLQTPSLIDAST